MANRKSELYAELRTRGGQPSREYIHYTIEQLLSELKPLGYEEPEYSDLTSAEVSSPVSSAEVPTPPVLAEPDPDEMPGQRLNTNAPDEIIRVDEQGRQWIQEEVRKPAYPKPRGRRVLTYMDTGVQKETVQNGEYIETFEIAGNRAGRPSEVKITLPSYQVGIYRDPRFPFKVHTYDGRDGFDLFEVQEFYGGAELVPPVCKRVYIENELCYDVRSVVQAINDEYRHLQMLGRA